jgi:RNA polymerase sigma factor (sigma-70 family)
VDEKQAALCSALDALTPRQRAVVMLRYCHDRDAEEVAVMLGVPVGTVRSIAYRAMTRLRAHPALVGLGLDM